MAGNPKAPAEIMTSHDARAMMGVVAPPFRPIVSLTYSIPTAQSPLSSQESIG